jgi:hypothetical protein
VIDEVGILSNLIYKRDTNLRKPFVTYCFY